MEEVNISNYVMLRGVLRGAPRFSHRSREERFYEFTLDVSRLSGTVDTIHIIAREALLDALEPDGEGKIRVNGELRSFNNKSGVGARLVITVFAREIRLEDGADENVVALCGILCKAPNYRVTPMGREICDLMLAVRRRYGRSDYLPCIAWGASARKSAAWSVGSGVRLTGRIQSRVYQKVTSDGIEEKTAFEVSVIQIAPDPAES
jgi:primosomal replication protein N